MIETNGPATAVLTAGYWPCTLTEYHQDRVCNSHSTLEVLRQSVPTYYHRFVLNDILGPPPTPDMVLGSALHLFLLERDEWHKQVEVGPRVDRSTPGGQQAWAEWLASLRPHALALTPEQHITVLAMAEGIAQNSLFMQILTAPGYEEQAVRWQDPDTGIWLKCRFDKLTEDYGVVDLKTTCCPTPPKRWAQEVLRYGYHRQAALYQEGCLRALGLGGQFLHLVVGNQEPYEAVVYQLARESIGLGREQNLATLELLAECRRFQSWDSRWSGRINSVMPLDDDTDW